MTSTPVAKVNSLFLNSRQGGKSGKTESSNVDFGLFMNQVTVGNQKDILTQTYANKKEQSVLNVDKVQKENYNSIQDKISTQDAGVTKSENVEKDTQGFPKVLEELQEKIKTIILENLDVSEEELEEVMETLGLQYVDLMIPENLINLVIWLTGDTEPVELLMNQEFQALFQTMEEMTVAFMEDLGFDMEQVQELISLGTESGTIQQELVLEAGEVQKEIQPKLHQDMQQQTIQQEVQPELAKEEKVEQQTLEEIFSHIEEWKDSEVEVNSSFADTTDTDSSENQKNKYFDTMQSGVPVTDSRVNLAETVVQSMESYHSSVDAENIMRQISEAVKINISPETTSMELQLTPENLGTINLQVIAKSGVITAQIATENEAVKAALESQIVQLRESMDNQGLKVEAIEVTIASHEFERNLEEKQRNDQREENSESFGKRRNLNLADLQDIQGIMSEDENLAVKIMLQNGNTIDYSA